MLFRHLKFATRIFLKDKFFSTLNILGLALGIAVSIILLLVLQNDLTYDQHYANHKRIYRLGSQYQITGVDEKIAYVARELEPVLREQFPDIEVILPVHPVGRALVKLESKTERSFYEEKIIHTDSSYFKVFDHPFLYGDVKTCLKQEDGVVITRSIAKKYFGDEPPLGQFLSIDQVPRKVTAVIETLPDNAHLKFDFLLSGLLEYRDWTIKDGQPLSEAFWNPDVYMYMLMPEGYHPQRFYEQWPAIYDRHFKTLGDQVGGKNPAILEVLAPIHFHSELQDGEAHGNLAYLYAFTGIGIFIVLLACINYMNLSTAKSVSRAKEVALKKITGSGRRLLVLSFLSESVLLSFISLLLAIVIVFLVLHTTSFNELTGKNLSLNFPDAPHLLWSSLGIAITIGLLSGLYPAFYLPGIPAIAALKGSFKNRKSSLVLRKFLITAQFAISILVVACTLLMNEQIEYLQNKDLGFDKENILAIPLRDTVMRDRVPLITRELMQNARITGVTSASNTLGAGIGPGVMFCESETGMKEQGGILALFVGDDYLKTMGITLTSGRDFKSGPEQDVNGAYIANESLVKLMGWGNEALGKKISFWEGANPGSIIGVVKDFNVHALYQGVDPMVIVKGHWSTGFIQIKLSGADLPGTIDYIRKKWAGYENAYPFEYFFVDQRFNEQYREDVAQNKLLTVLSYVCIFISLLGLVGLSAFAAIQRTKEIGVRKVLGANIPEIIMLLSRDVLMLMIFSAFLILPLCYWLIDQWLDNFAYRAPLNHLIYFIVTVLALSLVFLTVLFQSLKTARSNPVEALKYE